jgi:multicomponent Na+:H+ antiporter subunit G
VSVRDLAEYVLLALGGGIQVLSALGVLAMRNAFERLHYVATAGVGAALVCIAVTVRESFSLIGNKALLLAVFFLASGPVLVHATARAARVRGEDGWGVKESEVEEP